MTSRSPTTQSAFASRHLIGVAALAVLMLVAGQVSAQTLNRALTQQEVVPSISDGIYPDSIFTNDNPPVTPAIMHGDASAMDTDGDDILDVSAADLDGAGSGDVGVVDWVVVELRFVDSGGNAPTRTGGNNPTVVARKAGLLLSNGFIVDADSPSADGVLSFEDVEFDESAQDLYIVVVHRNHLPVMTATTVGDSNAEGIIEYDFTDSASKALGNALIASGGNFAAYRADLNLSRSINALDLDDVRLGLGQAQDYFTGDVNFSGAINDLDVDEARANIGISANFAL